ncbi:phosphatase PAP2 family protein [Actinoplanes sp. NPDC051475]|uniref:phosphatase PAP2 family protein n=1 Tax=Actinoplanes sp. NPDC051475 TaxID=3157225 RepID=UPI00344F62D7
MAQARTVKIGIAAAVVVLVAVAAGTYFSTADKPNPIKSHPMPALFTAAQTAPLQQALAAQRPLADQAYVQWAATHPGRDDAAFTAFAIAHLSLPPDPQQQAGELAEVRRLAAQRTPAGITAATWLEQYGKKNVWTLYAHDLADLQSADQGAAQIARLKTSLALAKSITAAAQARFNRQAPFIADPSLRSDKAGITAKLSYPSAHTADAFTALTLLARAYPPRTEEYAYMAAQVAYSRLYMAGHYRSDLLAGAFLGDLIGDYETGTTSAAACPPASTAPIPATSAVTPTPLTSTGQRPACVPPQLAAAGPTPSA